MAPRAVLLLLLLVLRLSCAKAASSSSAVAPPHSQSDQYCGNVRLPYPFGIGPGCSKDSNFTVYCNDTFSPPKAFLFSSRSNIKIISITLPAGQILISKHLSRICYNSSGRRTNYDNWRINLHGSKYRFSETGNVFTAVGCNSNALMVGRGKFDYNGGCVYLSTSKGSVEPGRCSGMGYCQTFIPPGLDDYEVKFKELINQSLVWNYSPCSYAFVSEVGWYQFNVSDLHGSNLYDRYEEGVPMVLDWVVGTETCEKAQLDKSSYACISANSICYDDSHGDGYRCRCSNGYDGNPYVSGGCQEIKQCERQKPCPLNAACLNEPAGKFTCHCPKGTHLDLTTNYCKKKQFPKLVLALGLSTGLLVLLTLGSWICWGLQRRKLMICRQKFFEQNGGLLLKRQIASHHGATFKIFTEKEIERATNMFDKDMVLGQGGQGTVYKGHLDGREVAIKKSRMINIESQRSEFAKELLILSQINHKNVVTLLGCCLEVDIPMLIYEFISNGTLFQYIHGRRSHGLHSPISFIERLRIASEAAQALNYLHADASTPIVHGDVKSANILLDGKFMVKISDFGASKLTPMDKTQFATLVQWTYGYLDPESLQTHRVTTKSDVYSFGVILAELLTRKTAFYSDGSREERSLALDFVFSMQNNQLCQILDVEIMNEEDHEYVHEAAKLTCRCLKLKGEERPTMREVAVELEEIRTHILARCEPNNVNDVDTEPLLGEQSRWYTSNASTYFDTASTAPDME